MDKYLIQENFHVYVSQGDGEPEKRVAFTRGMVVEASEIPEGHTGAGWVAKGLARQGIDTAA